MKRKRKSYSTKEKFYKYEYPDFILKISIVNYEQLKKWNLIDNQTYRKHIKKQIKKNYEGGDNNGY